MGFDVGAWRRAWGVGPWTFRCPDPRQRPGRPGRPDLEYQARDLSVDEVARFLERYGEAQRAGDVARARRQLRAFLRRLFPGLVWWTRPDPVELILQLPEAGVQAVLEDFFAHRGRRLHLMASMPRRTPSVEPSPSTPP